MNGRREMKGLGTDVQALVGRGFGSLGGARYVLLQVAQPGAARAWLRSLAVTTLAEAEARRLERVCQLAFTAAGLRALGLPVDDVPGFAPEFLDGMAGDPSRSRRLGDVEESAPEYWRWGSGEAEPHVLLMLLAGEGDIAAWQDAILGAMPPDACTLLRVNDASGPVGREPFGFVDGVSQPEVDWEGTLRPGGAKDRDYRDRIALGEFLLGHGNEYGFVADHPVQRGIGRNGTYLVYRQLMQDVGGFWDWTARIAGRDGAVALAERMVGRGIDGQPLPELAAHGLNGFTFAGDPDGIACPVGAHVRRANPRSGDDPQGRRGFLRDVVSSLGFKGTAIHDAVASARFHRLLRRGRPYGAAPEPLAVIAGEAVAQECGLHFICLNASLARQFEFVQGSWIASPYFGGLSGEQDPLLGNRCPVRSGQVTDAFAWHDGDGNPRLVAGLPRFVTVLGGAYFFLPGIGGLARILEDAP
ncbi:Dyp-type peroxidase [Novosphingobium resinovorum]|nr:peroxidase [Novosphingobium resinovorum]